MQPVATAAPVATIEKSTVTAPTRTSVAIWWAASALIVVHVIIAWLLRDSAIGVGNDDAVYLHLARSLRVAEYRDAFVVNAPWHSQYPPGYPALLAVLSLVAGERLDVFLAATILLSAGTLLLIFDATRRLFSPALALLVLVVSALNFVLLSYAGKVASEATYMALSTLALWLLTKQPDRRLTVIAASAAAIVAALTRSFGVTLLASLFLLWLYERRFRRAILFGAAATLTVGSWLAWTVVAPQRERGRSYIADATALIDREAGAGEIALALRIMHNARSYLLGSLPTGIPVPTVAGTLADNIAWLVLIVAFSTVGTYMLWKGRWRAVSFYLIISAAFLVLWQWPIGRFIAPLFPFIFLALLAGAATIGRRFLPRAPLVPATLLTLIIAGTSLRQLAGAIPRALDCDRSRPLASAGCFTPEQRAFIDAATWARTQTPPGTRFVSSKEGAFGFHSQRPLVTIATVLPRGKERLIDNLSQSNVSYVVVGTGTPRERGLIRVLVDECARFGLVASFSPSAAIFRVLPELQSQPGGESCKLLAPLEEPPKDHSTRQESVNNLRSLLRGTQSRE